MDPQHHARTILLKAWLIGLAVSLFAVVCTSVVHTPLALVGMVLSVPMLPCIVIFDLVTRGMGLGDGTMNVVLPASLAFFGSLEYGAIAFVVIRVRGRRRSRGGGSEGSFW
jgi:hypothetical protein